MATAYEQFNAEREGLLEQVHTINDQINVNRNTAAQKVKDWEAAVLAGENELAAISQIERFKLILLGCALMQGSCPCNVLGKDFTSGELTLLHDPLADDAIR